MDNDIVLNLTTDNKARQSKGDRNKGGRWTDRLKAKRVSKRKTRHGEPASSHNAAVATMQATGVYPVKRARIEAATPLEPPRPAKRQPTQIISSLFSSNPKIDNCEPKISSITNSAPSNAPLGDSSTFSGLGLDPLIVAHLSSKMNISKPTSIQRAALPALLPSASDELSSRDVFIQSQTGSGKTLSFLLPIIQDLLPLSTQSYIDRSVGTLAIIIAPTRELAKQISDVLETLLKLRLRREDEEADDPDASTRLTRWLVSGLLTGGATRTHEKARLRKGLPILVSTPGRLLDHLQNTSSFNVGKCRWLVLDEADRLMELGFEETITGIIQGLDGRRRLALEAVQGGKGMEVGGWDWARRRRAVLCSATIREDVQKLAGATLVRPVMVKTTTVDKPSKDDPGAETDHVLALSSTSENFTPPSQLSQKYVIVPLKLRLVALVALLRSLLSQSHGHRGYKIIVFFSCTDSVDFHWQLLGGSVMDDDDEQNLSSEVDLGDEDLQEATNVAKNRDSRPSGKVEVRSSLLPGASIFRLHGSLPTPTRLASLRGFLGAPSSKSQKLSASSILLCTSVASRGLDLPSVRAVVQYDLPTEGGATEYIHRVGRTARVGKGGEAWCLVGPTEAGWVTWVEDKMRGNQSLNDLDDKRNITLQGVSVESVLGSGFGNNGSEYEERATDVQLSFERWVLRRKQHGECARRAFLSHMRAYATHPSNEKHIFHVRHLHIGHLAKAFALREAPKSVTAASEKKSRKGVAGAKARDSDRKIRRESRGACHDGDAEKRMQKVVRSQGRLSKVGGVMMSSGASEFQIATGPTLEKVVGGFINRS